MKAIRKLWDRLNGDRMDAARARGVARRALFDPLPALDHGARVLDEYKKLRVENARLTQRVKDLEEENAFFRAIF